MSNLLQDINISMCLMTIHPLVQELSFFFFFFFFFWGEGGGGGGRRWLAVIYVYLCKYNVWQESCQRFRQYLILLKVSHIYVL